MLEDSESEFEAREVTEKIATEGQDMVSEAVNEAIEENEEKLANQQLFDENNDSRPVSDQALEEKESDWLFEIFCPIFFQIRQNGASL